MLKIFGSPLALGKNQKKMKKKFANKPIFFQAQSELYMFSAII